jgi:arylformamidase
MKTIFTFLFLLSVLYLQRIEAQKLIFDIPYAEPANEKQVLDIYTSDGAKNLPVVFWIHGGGWMVGDKTEVKIKPKVFTEHGFVFVSTNYRLLPRVEMDVLIRDVAKSLGWVYKNIAKYGGDPKRIFVMGHSAGAQLAALICIDDRYLKTEGVGFENLKGCIPLDGDTYDLPAIIMTAELTQTMHGLPLPEYGHRMKFGNDPKKFIDYSAVTHVAKGKNIPPFLILHIIENPNTTAQAQCLGNALAKADIPYRVFGARETTHNQINDNLGIPDNPATIELFRFLDPLKGIKP